MSKKDDEAGGGGVALVGALVGGFFRRVKGAVRRNGLRRAAVTGATRAYMRVFRPSSRGTTEQIGRSDAAVFDAEHGVETGMSWRDWAGLGTVEGSWEHGLRYEGVLRNTVLDLIRAVPADPKGLVFIDLGSGKGKALLVASELPFRRILGVEYSQYLHGVARKNIRNYRGHRACDRIESICSDAMKFDFPDEPLLIFLYNPFDASVLEVVVENLMTSLKEKPRACFIASCNMAGKHKVFVERGFREIGTTTDAIGTHYVLAYP